MPEPGAAVHRQARDVVAVHLDGAAVRRDQAGDHVEAGRLAGAVGTQQADHLAALERQADGAHDGALVEALGDAGDDKPFAAFDHAGSASESSPLISLPFVLMGKNHAYSCLRKDEPRYLPPDWAGGVNNP